MIFMARRHVFDANEKYEDGPLAVEIPTNAYFVEVSEKITKISSPKNFHQSLDLS